MRDRAGTQTRKSEPAAYATREDFTDIFVQDVNRLYQLAFLLTGDHEKAEKCLVAGIEDCVKENRVFREWARSWAKRILVQKAIRELKPRPGLPGSSSVVIVFPHKEEKGAFDEHFHLDAVLGLKDFERFVFVMAVLEHCSDHECALLLGCSVLEVREGRVHALEVLADRAKRSDSLGRFEVSVSPKQAGWRSAAVLGSTGGH